MGIAILIGVFGFALVVLMFSVIGLAMFVAHLLHSAFIAARSLFRGTSPVPPAFRRRQ